MNNQTGTPGQPQNALAKREDKEMRAIEYVPFGAQEKIKLSVAIVKNYLATPTKSGRLPSDRDCMRFLMLNQAKALNPWEGDSFLVGYDTQTPNGIVAQFSQITAHQAFLKRAEAHPSYEGMESGIILLQEDGSILEREGDFHLPHEVVVGGWARVHRKDRKIPCTRRVRLDRFDTGFAEWKKDKAGMICKCAEADAMRSSFPTKLGGLYSDVERREVIDISGTVPSDRQLVETAPIPPADSEPSESPAAPDQPAAPAAPAEPTAQKTPTRPQLSAQDELQDFVVRECGCTFDEFRKWAAETGNVPKAEDLGSFDEVSVADAKRLLRAKNGLKTQLRQHAGK